MQSNDPYQPPSSDVATAASKETYQPKIFTVQGRIGRLRYLAYTLVGYLFILPAFAIGGLSSAMESGNPGELSTFSLAVLGICYLAMIVYYIVLAKRRFNDMDFNGWMAALMFIPFVNIFVALWIIFAPGTKSANRYGPMPNENPLAVKILALAIPIIALVGILAAVLLPAFTGTGEGL